MKNEKDIAQEIIALTQNLDEKSEVITFVELYIKAM